jgi:hypothetical protein
MDLSRQIHGLGLLPTLLELVWLELREWRSSTVSLNKSVVKDLLCLQGRHEMRVFPSSHGGMGEFLCTLARCSLASIPVSLGGEREGSYRASSLAQVRISWSVRCNRLELKSPPLCSSLPVVVARRELLAAPHLAPIEASLCPRGAMELRLLHLRRR